MELRPFHEEPDTGIHLYMHYTFAPGFVCVMHSALLARPQSLVRSLQLAEV